MEWTESERGGLKLILDGYVYVKKRSLADGWACYECELRRNRKGLACNARVKVKMLGDNEFKEKTEHNHPPDHGKINAHKMKVAMKRKALETDEDPSQILMAALQQATDEGISAMPGVENIRRSIRRQRQYSREALARAMIAHNQGNPEDNGSMATEEGLTTQQGIWRSIRRWHQNIREAFDVRKAVEEQNIGESHRPSLPVEEGMLSVCRAEEGQNIDEAPGPSLATEVGVVAFGRVIKSENQDDIQENQEVRGAEEDQNVDEAPGPSLAAENSRPTFNLRRAEEDQNIDNGPRLLLAAGEDKFNIHRTKEGQSIDNGPRLLLAAGEDKFNIRKPEIDQRLNEAPGPSFAEEEGTQCRAEEYQNTHEVPRPSLAPGECTFKVQRAEEGQVIDKRPRLSLAAEECTFYIRRAEEDKNIDKRPRPLAAEERTFNVCRAEEEQNIDRPSLDGQVGLGAFGRVVKLENEDDLQENQDGIHENRDHIRGNQDGIHGNQDHIQDNQDDILEASGSHSNGDILGEVSGDQTLPTELEQFSHQAIKTEPGEISLIDWYNTFTAQITGGP